MIGDQRRSAARRGYAPVQPRASAGDVHIRRHEPPQRRQRCAPDRQCCLRVSLTTTDSHPQSAPRQHIQRRQCMADRAEIAAGDQQHRQLPAPAIQSSTVWRSSSGTMMPPTPSISSVPWPVAMMPRSGRGRRRAAPRNRSPCPPPPPPCRGDSGARSARAICRRRSAPGTVIARPSAVQQPAGVARSADRLHVPKPLITGFSASTGRPARRKRERISPAVTKVLPISGAGRGNEERAHVMCGEICAAGWRRPAARSRRRDAVR